MLSALWMCRVCLIAFSLHIHRESTRTLIKISVSLLFGGANHTRTKFVSNFQNGNIYEWVRIGTLFHLSLYEIWKVEGIKLYRCIHFTNVYCVLSQDYEQIINSINEQNISQEKQKVRLFSWNISLVNSMFSLWDVWFWWENWKKNLFTRRTKTKYETNDEKVIVPFNWNVPDTQ